MNFWHTPAKIEELARHQNRWRNNIANSRCRAARTAQKMHFELVEAAKTGVGKANVRLSQPHKKTEDES